MHAQLILIIVMFLLGASLHYFCGAVSLGQELANHRCSNRTALISKHKQMLGWAYGTLIAAVLFIELGIIMHGEGREISTLLKVHWVLVGAFLLLTLLTLRNNGVRARHTHARYAYATLGALFAVFVTGVALFLVSS